MREKNNYFYEKQKMKVKPMIGTWSITSSFLLFFWVPDNFLKKAIRGTVEYSIWDYLNIENEGTRLLVCWLKKQLKSA